MHDFTSKFFIAFIPIFVAIDAVGMVAIFIGLGADVDEKRRQQEALIGIGTALGISVATCSMWAMTKSRRTPISGSCPWACR